LDFLKKTHIMKTIILLRHAKSSWDFSHLSDHERPLLEKGKKRTRLINDFLNGNKVSVDMIISSHAVRAYETAKIIARAIGYSIENIIINKMIYHANAERLIDQFYDLPENIQTVMLVGHNPTLTNFANQYLDQKIDWLPTSGMVSIDFYTDKWENISLAKYKPNFVVFPKMLK
jgi:phosphohistidine phosphatase